jgi:hypothetical protein
MPRRKQVHQLYKQLVVGMPPQHQQYNTGDEPEPLTASHMAPPLFSPAQAQRGPRLSPRSQSLTGQAQNGILYEEAWHVLDSADGQLNHRTALMNNQKRDSFHR